jgi:hypothetical protein
MELVDMQGLKPCLFGGPGSSPGVGKIYNRFVKNIQRIQNRLWVL